MLNSSTYATNRLHLGIKATKEGKKSLAVKHLTIFLKQNPNHIEALLWLAFALPSAQDSIHVLQRVLALDSHNKRARAGLHWAQKRLPTAVEAGPTPTQAAPARPTSPSTDRLIQPTPRLKPVRGTSDNDPAARSTKLPFNSRPAILSLIIILAILVAAVGTLVFAPPESLASWLPATSPFEEPERETSAPTVNYIKATEPALQDTGIDPEQTPAQQSSGQVNLMLIPDITTPAISPVGEPAAFPVLVQTGPGEMELSSQIETSLSPVEPEAAVAELPNLLDTQTQIETQPVEVALLAHQPAYPGEKWIEVNATTQEVTAWEGNVAVMSFIVSTGRQYTPTIPGKFRIYLKLESTRMSGPGYNLPNVPYTMYYYKGYALHGAYWHDNFGQPMSHGCVNFRPDEAKVLFDWADPVIPAGQTHVRATADNPGTLVVVHN